MKIAFFSAYYYPHVGGYIVNIRTLAEALAVKGHDVTVVTCQTDDVGAVTRMDGVTVVRLPCWHLLGGTYPVPKPSLLIWGLLRRLRPDIVSTQTRFFPTSALGWLFGRLWKAKVVHTERGTQHSVNLRPFVDILSRVYDHTVGAMVIRWADARIGVSQAACDFSWHLAHRTTQRIPNGIDEKMLLGFKASGGKTVIFVGRLIQAKGVQDLLLAALDIWDKHRDVEFVIVGDGPYRGHLEEIAADYRSIPIRFTGEVSHEKVAEELMAATVFVNPSYSEGLPTSVLEAAAMGLPIVATDVGGTREIVNHENMTGLLMHGFGPGEIAEKVCRLLYEPEMALDYGRNARRLVRERFAWKGIVETYEALYESLVQGA